MPVTALVWLPTCTVVPPVVYTVFGGGLIDGTAKVGSMKSIRFFIPRHQIVRPRTLVGPEFQVKHPETLNMIDALGV